MLWQVIIIFLDLVIYLPKTTFYSLRLPPS
jgi:hypothetical protein